MAPLLIEKYAEDGSYKARRQMLAMCRSDPELIADVLGHFVRMISEKKILDDDIFVSQIQKATKKLREECAKHDPNGKVKGSLEQTKKLLIQNLKSFQSQYEEMAKEQESDLFSWEQKRLLSVLKKAELDKLFKIDSDEAEADNRLLGLYHHYLGFSMKGFSMVLKRDVDEVFVKPQNVNSLNLVRLFADVVVSGNELRWLLPYS